MFSGFSQWFSGGGGGKTQCLTLFRGRPQERSTEPEIMLDVVMPMSRKRDSLLVDGSHTRALTLVRTVERAAGGVKNHKVGPEG